MTYAETDKLIKAINEVEIWAAIVSKLLADENSDRRDMKDSQKWLDEAKQTIWDICAK